MSVGHWYFMVEQSVMGQPTQALSGADCQWVTLLGRDDNDVVAYKYCKQ